MLGTPARALPDPLAEVTQRQVKPGHVTAPPAPLGAAVTDGWPAGDVAGQAVPPPVMAHRLAERMRDNPPAGREVVKDRVLYARSSGSVPGW